MFPKTFRLDDLYFVRRPARGELERFCLYNTNQKVLLSLNNILKYRFVFHTTQFEQSRFNFELKLVF